MDTLSTIERSIRMGLVRGSGNKSTELRLIQFMQLLGIKGWRRRYLLPGKPDFVFPSAKLAVFVDGDFWHGNPTTFRRPKSKLEFWLPKIERNQARDRAVNRTLRAQGWTVLRIWESSLAKHPHSQTRRIQRALENPRKAKRIQKSQGILSS